MSKISGNISKNVKHKIEIKKSQGTSKNVNKMSNIKVVQVDVKICRQMSKFANAINLKLKFWNCKFISENLSNNSILFVLNQCHTFYVERNRIFANFIKISLAFFVHILHPFLPPIRTYVSFVLIRRSSVKLKRAAWKRFVFITVFYRGAPVIGRTTLLSLCPAVHAAGRQFPSSCFNNKTVSQSDKVEILSTKLFSFFPFCFIEW